MIILFKRIFLLSIVFSCGLMYSQNGIQLNSNKATKSYTLFETFLESYIVDNCGQIVNVWEEVRQTDLHAKLLPDGSLLYLKDNRIIRRDWDNNVISSTAYNAIDIELVYEVILMSNDHYLCLGRQRLSDSEFRALGYDLSDGNPERIDVVLEIDPTTEEIVWQWNIKDHMIQERDQSLANYGSVFDNPRKLDMDAISTFDWNAGESFMINGFDYNEELDLIALSVRKLSEVIIIDHSTTTEEASGSSGGYHDKGGDILFRWGNDQNYGYGGEADRNLYYQHNPNWINYGEHKGKIMIYNNGLSERNYSSVEIIDPAMDAEGLFVPSGTIPFGLDDETISINSTTFGPQFFSEYTSGAKVMPNGNIFVTEGRNSRLFEMTPEGEVVWEYGIQSGGYIFRTEKYPLDYPAFDGKNLTPTGQLEMPPSNYDCELISTSLEEVEDVEEYTDIKVVVTPDKLGLTSMSGTDFSYYLLDINGRLISEAQNNIAYDVVTSQIPAGNYLLRLEQNKIRTMQKINISK